MPSFVYFWKDPHSVDVCNMNSLVEVLNISIFKREEVRVEDVFFFFQAEDGIRDYKVTGVQTCALPISMGDATGGFDLREQGVDEIHVGRDADLRDEHDVQLVPGLLHDVHDVAIHVVRDRKSVV